MDENKTAKRSKVVYGVGVTPYGMYLMAQNYRATADALENIFVLPRTSNHPRRFLYYQAIEHFLRTFLRLNSQELEKIQGFGHRWGDMLDCCNSYGLVIPANVEKYIRLCALNNALVGIRYEYELDLDPGTGKKATRSTLPLEKTIYALELAVGEAIERTGREVFKRPDPPWLDQPRGQS
ncbi:hypothetical protein [Mesorhizobium sp. CO1-1-4]|uniref:hypothetical protein n=1 Tax=Mesorhizobium sp. CO1-1-4 TaxID=2876633 RepID=UPI001CCB6BE1|nr:hypothetical protein [Mesorhizobium sp. CO1-1-4]MBZ9742249.1 hypothetical protein [Mesorhizobium sp. CO1-1-4]